MTLGANCAQACLDVAQTLAVSQLGKGHSKKLLPAGKLLDVTVALIASHASAKIAIGEKADQLREDALALIHPSMLSGRNASGQVQIAASQNRLYPKQSVFRRSELKAS